jgi:hypothetical protein
MPPEAASLLLEVDTHDNHQVILRLLGVLVQLLGVGDSLFGVMDGAWAVTVSSWRFPVPRSCQLTRRLQAVCRRHP